MSVSTFLGTCAHGGYTDLFRPLQWRSPIQSSPLYSTDTGSRLYLKHIRAKIISSPSPVPELEHTVSPHCIHAFIVDNWCVLAKRGGWLAHVSSASEQMLTYKWIQRICTYRIAWYNHCQWASLVNMWTLNTGLLLIISDAFLRVHSLYNHTFL